MMQLTAHVAASVLAALLSGALAAYLLRRERSPETLSLVGFNVAVTVWVGGNALQVASTTLGAKLFWVNVQYVGIALLPLSIFAFAVHLSGAESSLSRRRVALLAAPLALLVVLSWTNGYHGLVRASATLTVVDGVMTLERTFGPAFWAGWVYTNLLNLVATVLVLRAVVYADRILERRVLALLIGPLIPWLAQFLYLTGALSIEPEVFFGATGLAFAYALVTWDSMEPTLARDAVLELLDEGVLVVSSDGRVADLNSAARDLLGLGTAPAVGEPVEDVLADYPELLSIYHEGVPSTDLTIEVAGDTRHLDVQFADFDNTLGSPDRIMVLVDVSALREQERELERQNERLESFASILSHDLRNPLSVAEGRLELAREDCDSEHLPPIERAHDRMSVLIDDVLTLAREGDAVEEPEPVAVAEAAESAWRVVETDGATLEIEADGRVLADESRLRQLFENLFRNSVEHGSTSGRASPDDAVEHGSAGSHGPSGDGAERDDGVTVTVGTTPAGFYVADDGRGIPESESERVFETGYTTGENGTGLGLNIVQEVAAAHDWAVDAGASEDGGARFEITGVERPERRERRAR